MPRYRVRWVKEAGRASSDQGDRKWKELKAYRRHAAQCRRLAENAGNGEDRTILLDMADSWDMLAEELLLRLKKLEPSPDSKK